METFDLSGFQMCHVEDKPHNILREKRVILGLTQKQVAERAKVVLSSTRNLRAANEIL